MKMTKRIVTHMSMILTMTTIAHGNGIGDARDAPGYNEDGTCDLAWDEVSCLVMSCMMPCGVLLWSALHVTFLGSSSFSVVFVVTCCLLFFFVSGLSFLA